MDMDRGDLLNQIDIYIQEFCSEHNIDDMSTEPQSKWYAALTFARWNIFPTKDILKLHRPLEGYVNNDNIDSVMYNINKSNCNTYDFDILDNIADIYIYLCDVYNKGCTIYGYAQLTGINEDTISYWGMGEAKLSDSSCNLHKKLKTAYENSLESKLWSNKNPVAHMAIANKKFGWNMPGVRDGGSVRALTAAELPQLNCAETIDNSNNTIDLTEQTTVISVSKNSDNSKASKIKGSDD